MIVEEVGLAVDAADVETAAVGEVPPFYRGSRDDHAWLRRRIRELAAARVRYGYRRIYVLLRREGLKVDHKRVRRRRTAS